MAERAAGEPQFQPPDDGVVRIQCWSGPRNISTALMYSWRQRPDTSVYDEPFYAHYLTFDDRGHPGVEATLASQSSDANEVIRNVILGPCDTPVFYIKNMAHHLKGVDRRHLAYTENVLLVRDPEAMLASLSIQLPNCDLSDTGLEQSVELLDAILDEGGRPLVIDSQALLRNPSSVLGHVCDHVGIEFDPAVLSWDAGPKPEDGAWAQYWYDNVHASTGFGPPAGPSRPVPTATQPVLEQALPLYERLLEYAIS